jgi:hypothetical protein
LWTLSLKPGGSATLYTIASSSSMRETDSSLVSDTEAGDGESARTQVHGSLLRLLLVDIGFQHLEPPVLPHPAVRRWP